MQFSMLTHIQPLFRARLMGTAALSPHKPLDPLPPSTTNGTGSGYITALDLSPLPHAGETATLTEKFTSTTKGTFFKAFL